VQFNLRFDAQGRGRFRFFGHAVEISRPPPRFAGRLRIARFRETMDYHERI
jgi:hypothetical protein